MVPSGKDPTLKLAYLNILSRSEMDGADELARRVWAKTVAVGSPFPLASAAPYIEHLIQFGQVDEAKSAWGDLEKLGVIADSGAAQNGNLIFNGDFERMPLNTGFDWRNASATYLALDFADPGSHSGKSCLRIDFTVSRNRSVPAALPACSGCPQRGLCSYGLCTLTGHHLGQRTASPGGGSNPFEWPQCDE